MIDAIDAIVCNRFGRRCDPITISIKCIIFTFITVVDDAAIVWIDFKMFIACMEFTVIAIQFGNVIDSMIICGVFGEIW